MAEFVDIMINDLGLDAPELPAWGGSSGTSIPEGWYQFRVTDATLDEKGQLVIEYEVVNDCDQKGKTIRHWQPLNSTTGKEGWKMRLKNIIQALGLPLQNSLSTATMLGLELVAEVWKSEYSNKVDAQGQKIIQTSTKVREEMRVDSPQARALLGYDPLPATPAQNENLTVRNDSGAAAATKVRTAVAGRAPNGNQPRR